jgi:hypothetical protein
MVTMLEEQASQYRVIYYGLTYRGYQEKPVIAFEKNV